MERSYVVVCALEHSDRYVLLSPKKVDGGLRWKLPEVRLPKLESSNDLSSLHNALESRFRMCTFEIRYTVRILQDDEVVQVVVTDAIQNRHRILERNTQWIPVDELALLDFTEPLHAEILLSWLSNAGKSELLSPLMPWWQEGWWQDAEHRLHDRLIDIGSRQSSEIKQVSSSCSAAVMTATTDQGMIRFQSVTSPFLQEPEVLAELQRNQSRYVPKLIGAIKPVATRPPSKEFLLEEVEGEILGYHSPHDYWIESVHQYAILQANTTSETETWIQRGCADLRISTLQANLDEFPERLRTALSGSRFPLADDDFSKLRHVSPQINNTLSELSCSGIPECLEHGNLHVGNLRWNRETNRPVFTDWSHACITFPFFGYGSLILDRNWFGAFATHDTTRLEWAYLSPWAAYVGLSDLAKAFVNWKQIRHYFFAVRQLAILQSFSELWADRAACVNAPDTAALQVMQGRLQYTVKRLLNTIPKTGSGH